MGVFTFAAKKINVAFLVALLFGLTTAWAQCPTVSNPNQSFCDLQSPTVASLVATPNGNGVQWYATATSTTPLSSSAGLVNGENYFADDNSGTCGTRASVTVTIYAAPTGQNFQGVCVGVATDATISDLIAVGNNIQWYSTPNNGTALSASTQLADNTIYYASQTNPNTGCETSRLSVFVNVGVVPTPTGSATQQFCNDPSGPAPTVADLVASGANNWYPTSTSAVQLAVSTPLVNGQSYFATTVDPPCESTSRFEVVAILLEPNDSGTNGVRQICQNQIATTPPFNLFSYLGGTPDTTGTWTGPIATSNGSQGTVNVSSMTLAGSPYVFTYTVNNGSCAPSSSTVTITILPSPTVLISGNTTICSGSTATVTFTGTPNATVTYTVTGVAGNQTIVLNGSGTASITAAYAGTTTYTLVSVASSGTPSCSQPVTGTVTISVAPLPTASVASNVSVCSGGSATVTFTGTPNATVTYTATSVAGNQTIVLNGVGIASITNNYTTTTVYTLVSVSSAGTPSCTRPLSGSITVTVIPQPVVTISGSVSVCQNGPATITFNGPANATVTYTVSGVAGNQTIVLNASGTATITGNFSVTTVYTLVSATTSGTPACTQPQTGSVTITVLPPPTASIAANTTICSGSSATVTFTGTPNASVTYTVSGVPGNQTILLNGSGTASITNTYTASTTFTLVSVASSGTPSCSQPVTGTITINVVLLPVVTISQSTTICPNQQATVTFTGTPNATVTYTVTGVAGNQTIVLNAAGTATITNTYATTTTYTLVSAATAGSPSCSQPQTGAITITVQPLPTASIASSVTICSGGNATVTFTGTPNATVTYTVSGVAANQTIVLNAAGNASVTGSYTTTTTFTLVSVTSAGAPGCTQPLSGTITISVITLPVVSIAASTTICTGNSATVTFTGTPNATVTYTVTNITGNQTIVLNAAGTASITNTYSSTTTFTLVSVATTGTPSCTQPQTGTVTITVLPPPTVSLSTNVTICAGNSATVTFTGTPNAVVTYTVSGIAGNQTIVLNASGTATITNTYNATTTFTLVSAATSGTPLCSQPQTGTMTITVVQLPVIIISGTASICPNSSATVTFTGTPNATVVYTVTGVAGNQTIVLNAAGTATITNTYITTTTYTIVSVTTSGTPACTQPQTGSVTITVLPPPVVAISGNVTVCPGGTATVTFTGTPNATITYTVTGTPGNQTIVLDASGTATVTGTYNSTTVYTLVSASTAGTPGCTQPQTGTVTVTVVPPPTVTISASTTVCSGGSATVTFTGTPNATVSYTVNGVAQSLVLSAGGSAVITANYTVTTTFTLVSATSPGTPPCPQPQTGSVIITVVPLPTVAISANVSNVCSGSSATVTFTGTPNATVTYTVSGTPGNQTIVLDATGTATISNSFPATTTYTLVSVSTTGTPACSQPQSGSVTITTTPPPVAGNDVANLAVCSNGPTVNLFTLLGPTAQPGGSWSPVLASGTGVFNPAVDPAGTYTYTVTGNTPCPNDTASVTVSLIPPPNAGVDAAVSICSNAASQDLFASLGTSAQAGGTWSPALASGSGLFNPTIDIAGTYTYTVTGTAPCGTDSAVVTVSITPAPNAGQDGAVSVCANGASQNLFGALGGTPQAGGVWTPTLASGSGIFNPVVDPAGTYTYTVNGTAPCVNDTAIVTISIIPPPNAGADATVNICSNSNPQDLFASLGSSAQPGGVWSPALASGSGVFNPAADPAGVYTYTVSGTGPCGSDSAAVNVIITPGPDAGQNGTLILCVDSASQDLFNFLGGTPQVGGTWSPTLASGTGVFNPAVDPAGVYTYTFFGNQPCDNDTATVTVTVNPIPDAGIDGTAFFCTNYAPGDLFLNLGGTPQAGGTWSPALASGTGVFNPLVDAPGTYTYSVGGNLCSLDTSTVTVSVTQSPNAGGNGATLLINACVTSSSVDLFTALNGSQGAGTWSDDDSTGALTNNIFNPSAVAPGSYHFTYTVGGGVSPCLFDSATVTVIVAPLPNAGTFAGIQNACTSSGTFDLSTLLTGQQSGGVWTDAGNNVVTTPLTLSGLAAGTYSYTYTVTNACGTDPETVQLTILPTPALAIPNITLMTPICIGENATITLNGMIDGTYIINYDLSGTNVLAGQSINVTIVAGTAVFIIPSGSLANTGTTTITFTGITNTATNCSATLANVLVNVVIRPSSNLDPVNLVANGACLGNPVTVMISGATGLSDGNYQFQYSIPGAAPTTGSTGIVAIAGGNGQFTVPGANFATAGNYTLTISGIISLSAGCSNLTENASVNFQILPAPDVTGAAVAASDSCIGFANQVSISGANSLADGTYTISYQLTGANTATETTSVTFAGGSGTFTIPATNLANQGSVTVTITQLTSTTLCGIAGTGFNTVVFMVAQPGTPVLIPQGDEFCAADNPTIATLADNISGTGTVVFYNALTGGTAYASTDLLQDGVTYYATLTASGGCESPARLPVTVDLTLCGEIAIPDGFSPNDDGINDEFVIVDLPERYPNFKLEIYNRYGTILYKGNINTPNWDGKSSAGGVKLGSGVAPVGVYFYILEFNDGTRKPVQGRVYLSR
jgi:mucin-2